MNAIPAEAKTGYRAPQLPTEREFADCRVAIVATRWNVEVVDALLAGAREALLEWGVPAAQIVELRAPGAFELPLACEGLARAGKYQAIIALGTVIRGDTPHFDYVAGECARGLQDVALRHALPRRQRAPPHTSHTPPPRRRPHSVTFERAQAKSTMFEATLQKASTLKKVIEAIKDLVTCLLYTSDAADE